MQKQFVNTGELLNDTFELALQILESNFAPNLIIGVWRGGSPIAIAIQEALDFCGVKSDHIPIRTSSYTGINKRTEVEVYGLDYLKKNLKSNGSILLVDDVFDTGLSMQKVVEKLTEMFSNNLPQIKIATPYFKPRNNQSRHKPDFYLHETESWLVFPHELIGLTDEEILEGKEDINNTKTRLLKARR